MNGLKPGKCYEFEIVAISREGESVPLKIADPIFTKDTKSRPSPPLNVEVCGYEKNCMHLKWTKPLSDGNARITTYVIEKKELNGAWITAIQPLPVENLNSDQLEQWVGNLITGKTYEFRICALNSRGISDPSASSHPQVCEAPYRKNTLNTFGLTSSTVTIIRRAYDRSGSRWRQTSARKSKSRVENLHKLLPFASPSDLV